MMRRSLSAIRAFAPAIARSRRRPRGRILAVKWGLNPNSSSLGVDVTFLLFGAAALSLATPMVAALLRWRRPAATSQPMTRDSSAPRSSDEPATHDPQGPRS